MRRTTLSRAAIHRVFAKGELRTGRLGRKVVVLEADLNAWIEARLAPKTSER
jgi:predicted DNA-binding transcriptional regulator AlpA